MTSELVVNTAALWNAVDALTKPTTQRVTREEQVVEWLEELHASRGRCDIATYRATLVSHGTIPSLWEQAEAAITTGSEQREGGGSPLAARSPADLDLMEIVLTIRESMAWQLPGRGVTPKPSIPEQMRQLASYVVAHEPQHVDWWTYRFAQWARLLAVYLHAVEMGPRAVRLRHLPCPKCAATSTKVETEQGEVIAPPIMVDFVDGWIRAAQCSECGFAWWRGQDLWDLAGQDAGRDTPTPLVADTA